MHYLIRREWGITRRKFKGGVRKWILSPLKCLFQLSMLLFSIWVPVWNNLYFPSLFLFFLYAFIEFFVLQYIVESR